ncbi:MAG: hypothetical protein ACRBF0_00220 [Calditrichia bacterium]
MYDVLKAYKSYLETDRRLPRDSVITYMGNIPMIFRNLKIKEIEQINAEKIAHEWRYSRWEQTDEGIRLSESAQKGYLPALKSFLRYLEDARFSIEPGLSDIIKLEESPFERLQGLSAPERETLDEFIAKNVRNDTQRASALLVQFLLDTGCSISEAVDLTVSADGSITSLTESRACGSFKLESGSIKIDVSAIGRTDTEVVLSDNVLTLLSLYLEKRKQKGSDLFLVNGRYGARRMTKRYAQSLIEKYLQQADIRGPYGRMADVLRATYFCEQDAIASMEQPLSAEALKVEAEETVAMRQEQIRQRIKSELIGAQKVNPRELVEKSPAVLSTQ